MFFVRYFFNLEKKCFNITMYADDTLCCNLNSILEAKRHIVLNYELEDISLLLFNVNKMKYMTFHTIHKQVAYPDLRINNCIIDRVSNFTYNPNKMIFLFCSNIFVLWYFLW